MQFKATLLAVVVAGVTAVQAASTVNLERRIAVPSEPANLYNCPPDGGADACNLEVPCRRIRINYGSRQQGHYIWFNYNNNNIPRGVRVGTEQSCSNFKLAEENAAAAEENTEA
ncbi:hypothetical protein AAF712_012125 [Marasmius tenuissimus]|uniref:Uncharacterized protein n=1 Tax=Marasmius tenuissimus TaxID=585030 RepID=A0ABR2ZKS6_9AGAR